jgi:hypothetical protein
MVINTTSINAGDSVGVFLDKVAVAQPMKSTNLQNTYVALWYNNGVSNLTQVVGVQQVCDRRSFMILGNSILMRLLRKKQT